MNAFEHFKNVLRNAGPGGVIHIPEGLTGPEINRAAQEVAEERKAGPKPATKAGVLDAAKAAVADRGLNYGKPEDNFERIAGLWSAHLYNRGFDAPLLPADIAAMMVLLKIARLENDPSHLDSWIDIAGYAACGAEISA